MRCSKLFCCSRSKAFPNCSRTFLFCPHQAQIIGSAATPLGPVKKTYDIGDGVTVPVNNKACIRKRKFVWFFSH